VLRSPRKHIIVNIPNTENKYYLKNIDNVAEKDHLPWTRLFLMRGQNSDQKLVRRSRTGATVDAVSGEGKYPALGLGRLPTEIAKLEMSTSVMSQITCLYPSVLVSSWF
jgi:hypothetical protein